MYETYPLTIRPRSDTESAWVKHNPVLKLKECVVSICENRLKYKVGDGVTNYTELPFVTLEYALLNGGIYTHGGQYTFVKFEIINTDKWGLNYENLG